MPTSAPRGPRRALRLRLRLLQIGLLVPVGITAALAAQYLRAVRARQQAIEVAAQQLAHRMVEEILVESSRRGDAAAHAMLEPIHALARPTPARLMAVMQRAGDSLRACRCGPLKEGAFTFVWAPATGEFAMSAPSADSYDPRQRLGRPGSLSRPAGKMIWAAGGFDSAGAWLVHYVSVELNPGRVALVGFDVAMDSWWRGTFQPAIHLVATRFFPMLARPDTAVFASLVAAGQPLAQDPRPFPGPTVSAVVLRGGPFQLHLTLNPAVLPLVLASAAPPSYPMLVGSLVASVLVSLLALLLLRQVHTTMAQREAFVASISHELRTPLTELLLHAESLYLSRQTPESNQRAAGTIVRETRRLIGLAENALAVAGAGRPAPVAPPAAMSVAPVIRDALQFLAPALGAHQARLDLTLDDTARVAIDPMALDRIVTNLVDNALRYGPQGQTIRVSSQRRGSNVELVVEDQGPGVPRRERRRIFAAFERGADARRSHAAAGVGLGLAIVKHLAASVGGTVGVAEAEGGGARFLVTLPADKD